MSLNTEDLEAIIMEHMEAQPYDIVCSKCGMGLEKSVDIDADLDLTISVEPCETCLEEASEEAREEASEEASAKASEKAEAKAKNE